MSKSNGKSKGYSNSAAWKSSLKRDWQLYLLLLIPLILVVVFSYGAYPGLRMAFMDYKPAKGFAGSKWVGFDTFRKVFKDADFARAIRNSVVFNLLDLLVGFPMPIILALILNELRYQKFKKGIPWSIMPVCISATFTSPLEGLNIVSATLPIIAHERK